MENHILKKLANGITQALAALVFSALLQDWVIGKFLLKNKLVIFADSANKPQPMYLINLWKLLAVYLTLYPAGDFRHLRR